MKPELPPEIAGLFPASIVSHIYSFVPHLPKQKGPPLPCTVSPNMERDLRVLQHSFLRGKNEMWLRDFDDFVLDRPVVKKSPAAPRRLELV
jgi:hypothetical protein